MVFLYYIDRVLLLFTVAAKCYFIENAFNLIPNVQVSMDWFQTKSIPDNQLADRILSTEATLPSMGCTLSVL